MSDRYTWEDGDLVEVPSKPKVQLTGTDGNVFALAGIVSKALKAAGQVNEAARFNEELLHCESYDAALLLMMRYAEVS